MTEPYIFENVFQQQQQQKHMGKCVWTKERTDTDNAKLNLFWIWNIHL